MASVLTDHVRHFGATSDPTGEVLPALERLLRHHMRLKNLLGAAPEVLGYSGVSSWTTANAFEDIVADCYIYAVLQRLAALRAQLTIKPNVDGLISRNVANFLLERQRRHDPIGYSVFGNVKGAALEAAAVKTVVLTNLERGKVHNGTVLRFADGNQTLPPAPPDLIQNAVRTAPGWSEAVPHLAETTEEGREWVLGFIRGLRATGIAAVRCGDLTAALAGRVRADWAARHADPASERAWEGDEEFGAVVRMVWPDESADSRERWERLKRAIPDRIASLDRQERVRERLAVVFTALARAIEESGHAPPTQAELTERTGIARATLSDDFRLLKELISELGIQNPDS